MLTGTSHKNPVAKAIYGQWSSVNEFRRDFAKHLPKGVTLPCQQTISRWVAIGRVPSPYPKPFVAATNAKLEDII